MTKTGDKVPEGNDEHDTTERLSSRQIDCARLIATSPGRSKQDIAASLRISRRTVFRWLADEAFQKEVEKFRRSKIATSDVKSIYGMLSPKDRKELLNLLLEQKENRHLDLPEIEELESKIMVIADSDYDPLQKTTRGAVTKVELLVGRLRRNALYNRDYEPDGSPIKRTLREFVEDLIETAVIATSLGEDKQLARAVAKVWRQIDQQLGEEKQQNPGPEWDRMNTNYDEEPEEDYADEWDEAEDESHEIDGGPKEWED